MYYLSSSSLTNSKIKSLYMFESFTKYLNKVKKFSTSRKMSNSNKLGAEKSPYLLQHQHNPVHWHPWNEETINLAKSLQKPIFLSSGYSTCHWCHVMERESFENPRIANIMNEHFINIKLDREEHPDIDRIYMTFVQAMTGSGGWPMSVWLTPELKPFYGGTYFPPEDRYFGRPGFKALLESIAEQWSENSEKCIESSGKILQVLQKTAHLPPLTSIPSAADVGKKCISQLIRSYEPTYGGFSDQPKFPQPVNLEFLIQYTRVQPDAFTMIEKTLKGMRKGGIYDHLGKGFCRYSTDRKWHVPHFEKMLYDQAQLTSVYLHAFLQSKDEFYSGVAKEVLEYVTRDMSISDGGFYSAEDADSLPTKESTDKKEGAFYVWTADEIEALLGDVKLSNNNNTTAAHLFSSRFGVKTDGNVDPYQDPHDELKGKNVLYEAKSYESLAQEFGIDPTELETILAESAEKLFEWRNQNRPRPHLDNKFITSWNGLMLAAFAQAGYILSNQIYVDRAIKTGSFIESQLIRDGDLLRTCYSDGEGPGRGLSNLASPIYGCVDDFSNVIGGFLDLFQATGEGKWLKLASDLQSKQNDLFWDSESGGYFTTRSTNQNVIVRMKDDDDGAEPSSNSTSLINLLRLQHLFPLSSSTSNNYSSYIKKLLLQFGDRLLKVPITLPLMSSALLAAESGIPCFIVIGNNVKDSALVETLRLKLLPTGSLVVMLELTDTANIEVLKSIEGSIIDEKLQAYAKLGNGAGGEVVIFATRQTLSHDAAAPATAEALIKTDVELEAFLKTL